jgi:hypothetical protein
MTGPEHYLQAERLLEHAARMLAEHVGAGTPSVGSPGQAAPQAPGPRPEPAGVPQYGSVHFMAPMPGVGTRQR